VDERWVRREDVLWRVVGDAVVLLRPDAEPRDPVTLTEPGGTVWKALAEPRSVAELAAAMAERYEGDPHRIRSDLQVLVEDLHEAGFVRRGA
jgi:hypothetical protein